VAVREAIGSDDRRNIEINIEDTGVGIANARKSAIFDAFVQADASVSRQFGGSGLGLSISRNLARLMGGTITLESEEDKGTVATFTLPLDEVFAPALTAVRPPRGKRGTTPGAEKARRRASVLLVEDIDINQELITEMLNRLGHSVDVAKDGSEALTMAGRLESEPDAWDLILMDVQMPVMDGLSATRAIRALGGRAGEIPIVALTANAFAVEMEACREAGMDDHIAKPSGFAQLRHAVELWGNVGQSRTATTEFGALEAVSIADRFEARLQKSSERLTELAEQLSAANDEEATPLMREAAGIAHVLAGTAAMFGQAPLGNVAHEMEIAIRAIASEDSSGRGIAAAEAIDRLLAALEKRPRQSAASASARTIS
jgi:CheY-like chemotaxis protein/HPt (histidine-containing phosphotransfer) domain-containing protein